MHLTACGRTAWRRGSKNFRFEIEDFRETGQGCSVFLMNSLDPFVEFYYYPFR